MGRSLQGSSGAAAVDARWLAAGVLGLGTLLRLAVGLHGYSGAGTPPLFGDFEAQRHWMEITINTPVRQWYTNTTANDLAYWGLDYPPLTAYQSWACGKVLQQWEPQAVALGTSRGYETASSKCFLRWSVLAFDWLGLWVLAAAVLQPAAILIDHGHFQYNNIGLGLSAATAAAIVAGREVAGSALFCLALNHKQMNLYYAPAFFGHLLGRCLQRPTAAGKAAAVARLGATVVVTFAVLWAPWLWPDPGAMLGVLGRLAPLRRGLYEDYVANFWCATAPLARWRARFPQPALVRLCAAATLAAAVPSAVQQTLRPSATGLARAMACSALAFFLFAYQVHEKSVLLPLLPVTLLAAEEPTLARWLPAAAAFSMFPLLKKDSLVLAYAALLLAWAGLAAPRNGFSSTQGAAPWAAPGAGWLRWAQLAGASCMGLGVVAALCIHMCAAMLAPPARYPFLWDYMIVASSFLAFACTAVYLNCRQWQAQDGAAVPGNKKSV